MSRLRWPDSTNSVSEKPGTIHRGVCREVGKCVTISGRTKWEHTCRKFRPRWTHCVTVGVQNLEVGHEQSSAGHSAQETGLGARGADRQRAKDLPLLRRRKVRVLRLEEGV